MCEARATRQFGQGEALFEIHDVAAVALDGFQEMQIAADAPSPATARQRRNQSHLIRPDSRAAHFPCHEDMPELPIAAHSVTPMQWRIGYCETKAT